MQTACADSPCDPCALFCKRHRHTARSTHSRLPHLSGAARNDAGGGVRMWTQTSARRAQRDLGGATRSSRRRTIVANRVSTSDAPRRSTDSVGQTAASIPPPRYRERRRTLHVLVEEREQCAPFEVIGVVLQCRVERAMVPVRGIAHREGFTREGCRELMAET
eukprot:7381908-Prymnesium_polylepis.1